MQDKTTFDKLKRDIQLLRIKYESLTSQAADEVDYRAFDMLLYKIKMICNHPHYVVQDLVAKAIERKIEITDYVLQEEKSPRGRKPKKDRSEYTVISDSEEAEKGWDNPSPRYHV